jgi:hypothetical protein
MSAYVSIRQHTFFSTCVLELSGSCNSAANNSVSIRQHTPAYVCIRQHTFSSTCVLELSGSCNSAFVSIRQHTSAYASIRHHTSAYVLLNLRARALRLVQLCCEQQLPHTSAYASISLHTSAYVLLNLRARALICCEQQLPRLTLPSGSCSSHLLVRLY